MNHHHGSYRCIIGGMGMLSAFVFSAPTVALSQQSTSGPITIRYVHQTATAHPDGVWGRKFAEVLGQKTGGKVKVEVYSGGQLGSETEATRSILQGTLEMQSIGVSYLSQFVPEIGIYDLPYLFNGWEQFEKAQDGPTGARLNEKFAAKGLKILGTPPIGLYQLTNSKRALETPNDLRGLKMRVPPGKTALAMMNAFGANTVVMNYGEVYSALQQGVIDGHTNPPLTIESGKFFEVQKYLTLTSHVYASDFALIGVKQFDSYPAEIQKAILEASAEATKVARAFVKDQEAQAIERMKAAGLQVNIPKDLGPWRQAGQSIYAQMAEIIPPEWVKEIQELK
jgi:tripartite ATP-independent transporter DctP family solute receptor